MQLMMASRGWGKTTALISQMAQLPPSELRQATCFTHNAAEARRLLDLAKETYPDAPWHDSNFMSWADYDRARRGRGKAYIDNADIFLKSLFSGNELAAITLNMNGDLT